MSSAHSLHECKKVCPCTKALPQSLYFITSTPHSSRSVITYTKTLSTTFGICCGHSLTSASENSTTLKNRTTTTKISTLLTSSPSEICFNTIISVSPKLFTLALLCLSIHTGMLCFLTVQRALFSMDSSHMVFVSLVNIPSGD